jgi:type III secretion protein T
MAIAGDRVYVQGMRGNQSVVIALNRSDGKEAWSKTLGQPQDNNRGPGPRGTPTVDGDRLYALTENGDLGCMKTADGSVVWQRNILDDFGGAQIKWLISESPLVDGPHVIVSPGGEGAGMVKLDKLTGKTVWTSKDLSDAAGYSSPIVADVQGVRTYLTFTAAAGVGVRASDGKLMFRYPKAANNVANMMLARGDLPFGLTFIGYMVKELLIGAIIGFLSTVPFLIAQMAGSLIDHQRGASALQVTDPTTQSQTGSIGQVYNYILIALFFSLNGPFLFLDGVATSYQLIPVDRLINPDFFSAQIPFWKQIIGLHQMMMNICIQLSAPALIGILLTDMFLGIANRLAPQVQIVFLGIALKSWVGIALMTAAWALIIRVMGQEATSWFKTLNQFITTIGQHYTMK